MAFKDWATSEGLVYTVPLSEFRNRIVAIEADDYLDGLLSSQEPLRPALGGLPFTLKSRVDDDLKRFKEAGIIPWFIFSGIDLPVNHGLSWERNEALRKSAALSDAWATYNRGSGDESVSLFGTAYNYNTYNISRWLMFYLYRAGIFIQVAPYAAAAQLAYMKEIREVDMVMGSPSMFVFGVDKVMIRVNWETMRAVWVDIKNCLNKLGMEREQFNDFLLLSGCSILSPLIDEVPSVLRMQMTRDLMARYNNDGWLTSYNRGENYVDAYQKAVFAVKHAIVLRVSGAIEPKDAEKMPKDYHEFLGASMPPELMFYMTRGLISPRLLDWRLRAECIEMPPLDSGDSDTYHKFVSQQMVPAKTQVLLTMTSWLHRYFHKRDVNLLCWFSEEKKPLGLPELLPVTFDCDRSWHVQSKDIDAKPCLGNIITMLGNDEDARKTKTLRAEDKPGVLREPNELTFNTIGRFLQASEYVDSDHVLTAKGRAYKASLERAKKNGLFEICETRSEVEEALFICIELQQHGLLHSEPLFQNPPYSGVPLRGSDADKANALLVARIACLATFHHRPIGYTGPLSRNLLAYHQMVAVVRQSLRDLAEVQACSMYASGAVKRGQGIHVHSDLATTLPFENEPNLGMALVVKMYLDEITWEQASTAEIVSKWFCHATDPERDLERVWKLWDAVNAGVQAGSNQSLRQRFSSADEWLKRKTEKVSE